jgi:hypothetical protein
VIRGEPINLMWPPKGFNKFKYTPVVMITNSTSGTGYGGYIVETPIYIAHGMWLDSEKGNSSTWKELTAVKQVLLSFIIVIRGEPINLVWPPKGFNKFKYNIRYTPVVMITNSTYRLYF